MNCTTCEDRVCHKQQKSCDRESFVRYKNVEQYLDVLHSEIIKAAAELVDSGRAGTLSRLEEIMEFAKRMNYQKLGIAYCYGMEKQAKAIEKLLMDEWFDVSSVSCSVGGLRQSEINIESCSHKVSCNPLGQAEQLNAEKVDLTLVVGICMGHDILLNRNLSMDFTTLVVKDRKYNHAPLMGIDK